jgi:hypothetical protein
MSTSPKALEDFISTRKQKYGGGMINVEGISPNQMPELQGDVAGVGQPDIQASPVQASSIPTEDFSSTPIPNVSEREEQIEQLVRDPASSGADASNLWYFLPAALGALTGNLGEGAGASADIMGNAINRSRKVQDDQNALDRKLKELALRRNQEGGGKGSFQIKYLENPDTGKVEAYNYNTQTGEYVPLGMKAGFAKQLVTNPLTGELEVASKADGKATQYQGAQRDNTQKVEPNSIKGIKVVKDFEKEVQKDPDYTKHTGTIESAKSLALYIKRNTKLDAKAIGPALTFLFEGPQRLTDEDVVRYRLPEGAVNKINEYIQMGLGEEGLTPEYQAELAGMLEDLAARASFEGQNVLKAKTQDFQSSYGFDPSEKLSNLYRPFKAQDLKKSISSDRPIKMDIEAPTKKNLRGQEVKPQAKKSYKDMSIQELEELAKKKGLR